MLKEEMKTQGEDIEPGEATAYPPSQHGEILPGKESNYDPVFGEGGENSPKYRSLGFLGTIVLMMKAQIGLGVLSIPYTFDSVGMIPGVLLICAVAGIATWTSYMVGVFKLRHPEVYGIDDAGRLMFGRLGREVLGAAFSLSMIFVSGSGILGMSIGLNAISSHGTCTAVFVVVCTVLGFLFASIRTLSRISWVAWAGLACILVAFLIVTISVGIQDRPSSAPQEGEWVPDYKLIGNPLFVQCATAVSSIIFACSATPAYFAIAAEVRDPRYFTKSVIIAQIGSTLMYITIGVVLYYYCGSYVASPALGSAGPLIKKIAYGISLPGLAATTTICIHLPSKYVFVRILRGSVHLSSDSLIHWATWLGCTFSMTLVAYLIASSIPFFDSLVSLIGALLGTFLAYQPSGCMWLYDNWSRRTDRDWKWTTMACWSGFIIVVGTFITIAGTYGSIVGIIDLLREDGGSKPWTCADNSI